MEHFTSSIMQGCPFSPLMLAAIMVAWVAHMETIGVGLTLYLDDRTFLATVPDAARVSERLCEAR